MLKHSVVLVVAMAACAGSPKPAPSPIAPVAAIAPTPSVTLGLVSASSGEDALRRDLESHMSELQRCHEARGPEAKGVVTVWLRVTPDGAVAETTASGDDAIAPCFADVVRGAKFSLDGAGVAAQVTFKLEPIAARPALARHPDSAVGHK